MSGIYGTVKPATINVAEDVEIFYSYQRDRSSEFKDEFLSLDPTYLFPTTAREDMSENTTIEGLYNLKLPSDIFKQKGIYTVYIKPKTIKTEIYAIGTLDTHPDIRGVIFDKSYFPNLTTPNALVGYRIEYTNGMTRIITSSNLCTVKALNGINRFIINNNTNSNLIFCTVTPSSNSVVSNESLPIGEQLDAVRVTNTKFNPIMFEIEMVEHDAETLSYMLTGTQVRNLDTGILTTYNHNNEIYKQFDTYTFKTQIGKPLYDIKQKRNTIDTTQSYNSVFSDIS